jgi:hypothetical protein
MNDKSSSSRGRPLPPPLRRVEGAELRRVELHSPSSARRASFETSVAGEVLQPDAAAYRPVAESGQFRSGSVPSTHAEGGPISAEFPRSAVSERTASSMADAEADAAREAFRLLYRRLQAMPTYEVVDPRLRVSDTLHDAARLEEFLARPSVRVGLGKIGVSEADVSQLTIARRALHYVETCVRHAQGDAPGGIVRLEHAARLRAELRECCQWNLRAGAHAEALARITDSEDSREIALDLSELSRLVTENWAAFAADATLDLSALIPLAQRLARQFAVAPEADGVKGEWLELRARAYTHLLHVLQLLREAGRYAFRADPAIRVAFSDPERNRSRGASLAGRVRASR